MHPHPKSTVYTGVTFCGVRSVGLDKCTHRYSVAQGSFTALKVLCSPITLDFEYVDYLSSLELCLTQYAFLK